MRETGSTITEWAIDTFGETTSSARIASRANEEMAELLTKVTMLSSEDSSIEEDADIAEECADICIVLARLSLRHGYDLFTSVDAKMEINRGREWIKDGSGHGQHVK